MRSAAAEPRIVGIPRGVSRRHVATLGAVERLRPVPLPLRIASAVSLLLRADILGGRLASFVLLLIDPLVTHGMLPVYRNALAALLR